MQTTLNKAIITGNLHELFIYKEPVQYGFKYTKEQLYARKRKAFSNSLDMTVEEIKERQQLYLKCSSERAKLKIRRLIQGNMYRYSERPKFLTLTFDRQIEDLKSANKEFTNFIKRFDRYLGYKVRYVAVPEFQKNGRVHYHMILFNSTFIAGLFIEKRIWKNGGTNIQTTYKTKGLATYMTKYISKSFLDPRYKSHKRYFFSLEEHTTIERQEEIVKKIINSMDSKDLFYQYSYFIYDYSIKDENERLKKPKNHVVKYEYMVGLGGVVTPPLKRGGVTTSP